MLALTISSLVLAVTPLRDERAFLLKEFLSGVGAHRVHFKVSFGFDFGGNSGANSIVAVDH